MSNMPPPPSLAYNSYLGVFLEQNVHYREVAIGGGPMQRRVATAVGLKRSTRVHESGDAVRVPVGTGLKIPRKFNQEGGR